MLDLRQYNCLGEALQAAIDRWPDEICLIEADRDREKARFTYRQFSEAALPLRTRLARNRPPRRFARRHHHEQSVEMADFRVRDFFRGGVLVPLDYKLTASEQSQLLAHSKAEVLIIEYHLWRASRRTTNIKILTARTVIVT